MAREELPALQQFDALKVLSSKLLESIPAALRRVLSVGVAGLLLAVGAPSWAQSQTEIAKLLASDGAADDIFGHSVAISGDTAVVGAPGKNISGANAGCAFVYGRNAATGLWSEQARLLASDGSANDWFGHSVAVSGNTAVVGAFRDYNGNATGSAYVFERDPATGNWTERTKLLASDGEAGDYFGVSVAVSGDTVVIGAYSDDDAGNETGSAYVFVRDAVNGNWAQQAKLLASDAAANSFFGVSVAVSGDSTIVGAFTSSAGAPGSAYVFVRDPATGNWIQQAKLLASDGAAYDQFGGSVAIQGNTVVVGAPSRDETGPDSGSAYVFERNPATNLWTQQAKLLFGDGAPFNYIGNSVAVVGNTAVVGSQGSVYPGTDAGAAYVFVRNPVTGSWTQQAKFLASDAGGGELFGLSVAVAGDTAIAGAPYDDTSGGTDTGSAYILSLKPAITSPKAGIVLAGSTQTVSWQPGIANVTQYWVYAGSNLGGNHYFDSGNLGVSTSVALSGLPGDGTSPVYVRLWYQIDGTWLWSDAQYTAASVAVPTIASPSPGSAFESASQSFQWSGPAATKYWVYAGPTQGSRQYFDSGDLNTANGVIVNGLPTNGSTVHVRLWYQLEGSSSWPYIDAIYSAATGVTSPTITSPTAGSKLTDIAQSFSWSANGTGASNWWLYAGDRPGGKEYFDSGALGTATTANVTGLPDDGSQLHVRLWYQSPGSTEWRSVDTSYVAAGNSPAQITSPAPGTNLIGTSATFNWTDNGSGVQQWWLYVGSAPGLSDFHDSGDLGLATSYTASGLPHDGSSIHVSLWYRFGAIWQYESYSYTSD